MTGALFVISCEDLGTIDDGTDARDKFIGEWRLTESSMLKSTKAQSYLINIVKDQGNSSQVIIQNMGNPGSMDVTATAIVTSGRLVISSQKMSCGWTIEGDGKITNVVGTTSAWSYSILAGGSLESYTATGTKQ